MIFLPFCQQILLICFYLLIDAVGLTLAAMLTYCVLLFATIFIPPFPGKELFGLDTLHKVLWIKLLEEMFLGMPSEYPWGDEIMLFLNVFNGALLLHPEDSALLRQYSATAINTAVHFNHLFSLSGYQWILPTMLQVSSTHMSYDLRMFYSFFMMLM